MAKVKVCTVVLSGAYTDIARVQNETLFLFRRETLPLFRTRHWFRNEIVFLLRNKTSSLFTSKTLFLFPAHDYSTLVARSYDYELISRQAGVIVKI